MCVCVCPYAWTEHMYSSVFKRACVCEWMSVLSSRIKMSAERRGGTLPVSTYSNGQPLVYPALESDTVVVTHMLHPGCICGVLMRSRILILSGCLLCFFIFFYLFSLLFKRYANETYACVCMCESQGCVNAVLDTSACLMDTTSLDMVIIMDVQERCDLTLSQ